MLPVEGALAHVLSARLVAPASLRGDVAMRGGKARQHGRVVEGPSSRMYDFMEPIDVWRRILAHVRTLQRSHA
jgi:hypothetical protein